MEILVFILVIVVLIVVHEFGHFVAAKLSGMQVDEFGLGYPPRAATLAKVNGTAYTLNWIPFGGFVKIRGENGEEKGDGRSFADKNRFAQAVVLVAGVAMNVLLAYVLLTGALFAGTPRALAPEEIDRATGTALAVANVLPGSPAATAGLRSGDTIVRADAGTASWEGIDPESFTTFVSAEDGKDVVFAVMREGTLFSVHAKPMEGIVASDPTRAALGVEVATIGVVPLSPLEALSEGAVVTWEITKATAVGLTHFFVGIFTLHADLSQVSGPIGIAGAVGDASAAGFGNLVTLVAVISINLALINLIPIPALDGGRLLFVLVEAVTRRRIKPAFSQAVNGIGFVALILLMVVVTLHDVFKLFG